MLYRDYLFCASGNKMSSKVLLLRPLPFQLRYGFTEHFTFKIARENLFNYNRLVLLTDLSIENPLRKNSELKIVPF